MGILRFLLALAVVIDHSAPVFGLWMVGGSLAVQSFYIISGFYMALILSEKYVGENASYKLFITNRLLRLYPLYWAVLVLTIVCAVIFPPLPSDIDVRNLALYHKYMQHFSVSTWLLLVFSNAFIFLQDLCLFLGLNTNTNHLFFTSNFLDADPVFSKFMFLPQAWTIALELTFYLLAPMLNKQSTKRIVWLIAGSFALRLFVKNGLGLHHDPWTYRFFPTELLFFLLGILLYRAYRQKHLMLRLQKLAIPVWIGIISFTIFYSIIPGHKKMYVYITCFCMALPMVFHFTKNKKWDRYLGELSYPIYLVHVLVIALLSRHFNIHGEYAGMGIICITVASAIVLYFFIEKPVEQLRQNRLHKKVSIEKEALKAGIISA